MATQRLKTGNFNNLNAKDKALLQRSRNNSKTTTKVNPGNRGMKFEKIIENTNNYYKHKKIAMIRKIPTPIKVVKRKGNKIVNAFFEKKSSLDFNGVINGGVHIDFDTKETKSKTSFPFGNVSEHQFRYMKDIKDFGAISFLLIRFSNYNTVYVLRLSDIDLYLKDNPNKKSIPYKYFQSRFKDNLVKESFVAGTYIYDYIPTIKKLYNL